jgi:GAF domain-containing protein
MADSELTWQGETPEEELAAWMATVARELAAEPDVRTTAQRVVDIAVDTIESADYAGISLVGRSSIETPASHGKVPRRLDELQEKFAEGPCVDAMRDHEVYEVGDLTIEARRWPRFATHAVDETEVHSILALRLFVTEAGTVGALNLYSVTRDAFDDHDRALASVFAAHAAGAVRTATTEEQLEKALVSRDVIGQAKGLLMSSRGLTADEAFDLLAKLSQRQNRKLRDIAGDVIEHRDEL